jgi:group I intron endonuclease
MTSPRFTIYCHTNRVNGKRYVGQTVHSMEKRWGNHIARTKTSDRRSPVFANAIRKYGADAFDHQILEVVSTQEEADLYETLWIEQMECRVPNGYNLKSGGGAQGHLHDDTKKLIRESAFAQHARMTSEERKAAAIPRIKGLRAWWAALTPEERAVLGCLRAERTRARYVGTTAEERRIQARKGKTVTPEKLSANALKGWGARRAKYGQNGGVKCTLTREQRIEKNQKSWKTRREKYGALGRAHVAGQYRDAAKKGWAGMTPKAQAEHGGKTQEGMRKAREAREVKTSRLIRVNFLRAP